MQGTNLIPTILEFHISIEFQIQILFFGILFSSLCISFHFIQNYE